MATTETIEITRDAIYDMATQTACMSGASFYGYSIRLDAGSHLAILYARMGSGYARSERTGQLYYFRQTGNVRGNRARCQIVPAVDTNDRAGTLRFDAAEGKTGGYMPADLATYWVA